MQPSPVGLPHPLIWGLHFRPDAPPAQTGSIAPPDAGWVWGHVDLVHAGATPMIDALACLPEPLRLLLAANDETPRLAVDADAVGGVLPGIVSASSEEDGDVEVALWRFAMRPDLIVTARRQPQNALRTAWEAASGGNAPEGPPELLAAVIQAFTLEARRRAGRLDDALDAVEEGLLGRRADLARASRALSRTRLAAARLRHAVGAVLRLWRDEAPHMPRWSGGASGKETLRSIEVALGVLQALQDRAHLLHDEIAARQAEDTNRRLYVLSIVTAVGMPAALVTGFFGMNTGGMPWAQTPAGTVFSGLICVSAALGTLLLLRWKRLI